MGVAAAIEVVVLEDPEDLVAAGRAIITREAVMVAVAIDKEMAKETIRTMIATKVMEAASVMARIVHTKVAAVVNARIKTTMVEVATKVTTAIVTITRTLTDHLPTEEVRLTHRKTTTAEVRLVEMDTVELHEVPQEAAMAVDMKGTRHTLKNKEEENGGQCKNQVFLVLFRNRSSENCCSFFLLFFFLRKYPLFPSSWQ